MCRLSTLLRSFQLPRTASASELRRAYFREAKRLHPDCNPSKDRTRAARDFTQLRADFEEALDLIGGGDKENNTRRWSSSAWTSSSAGPSCTAVPVVGLPQELVYPVALALSVAFCMLLVSLVEPPERSAKAQDSRSDEVSEHGSNSSARLRVALDGQEGAAPASRLRGALQGQEELDGALSRVLERGLAHAAAETGEVWWLERCGALPLCRPQLHRSDGSGDTPLHHCARAGQDQACRTLLRLGADPAQRNRWNLAPEHLALHCQHDEIAALIRGARRGGAGLALSHSVWHHPDGLGTLAKVESTAGTHASETLRHAANLALGGDVVESGTLAAVSADFPGDLSDEFGAVACLRIALQRKSVSLEELPKDNWFGNGGGLLVYEPPGHVTLDAPGHWVAVRPAGDILEAEDCYLRLDPVRGAFRLTLAELVELLERYKSWRLFLRE